MKKIILLGSLIGLMNVGLADVHIQVVNNSGRDFPEVRVMWGLTYKVETFPVNAGGSYTVNSYDGWIYGQAGSYWLDVGGGCYDTFEVSDSTCDMPQDGTAIVTILPSFTSFNGTMECGPWKIYDVEWQCPASDDET